jgi:hypothetical protein
MQKGKNKRQNECMKRKNGCIPKGRQFSSQGRGGVWFGLLYRTLPKSPVNVLVLYLPISSITGLRKRKNFFNSSSFNNGRTFSRRHCSWCPDLASYRTWTKKEICDKLLTIYGVTMMNKVWGRGGSMGLGNIVAVVSLVPNNLCARSARVRSYDS